ncbi:hypothetical protein R6Z07F_002528 [Ovis aries]
MHATQKNRKGVASPPLRRLPSTPLPRRPQFLVTSRVRFTFLGGRKEGQGGVEGGSRVAICGQRILFKRSSTGKEETGEADGGEAPRPRTPQPRAAERRGAGGGGDTQRRRRPESERRASRRSGRRRNRRGSRGLRRAGRTAREEEEEEAEEETLLHFLALDWAGRARTGRRRRRRQPLGVLPRRGPQLRGIKSAARTPAAGAGAGCAAVAGGEGAGGKCWWRREGRWRRLPGANMTRL